MLLGAIADDLTGATDLALTLSRGGMLTVQVIGVPEEGFDFGTADAVVVALKSRTIPAEEAVSLSVAAADRLLEAGAEQIIFKYCSTFDSTDKGNIGPVTEALLKRLDEPLTIVCTAFPTNGRTIYKGNLFVGDTPLSESPMKDHPLTPMNDSNLQRVLQRQTSLPVGLISYDTVERGPEAIVEAFAAARGRGIRMLVVDALSDKHLMVLGQAVKNLKLVTGGSGIGLGLPRNFRRSGKLANKISAASFELPAGKAVILVGSCSTATRRQIEQAIATGLPSLRIEPRAISDGSLKPLDVADWVRAAGPETPLVYSSDTPENVRRIQALLGRNEAGAMVENLLADVALLLRDAGYRQFLIAGGETSGAIVQALGVTALEIGPEIDPGVPWTRSLGSQPPLALALKSGNFGSETFFTRAWSMFS